MLDDFGSRGKIRRSFIICRQSALTEDGSNPLFENMTRPLKYKDFITISNLRRVSLTLKRKSPNALKGIN